MRTLQLTILPTVALILLATVSVSGAAAASGGPVDGPSASTAREAEPYAHRAARSEGRTEAGIGMRVMGADGGSAEIMSPVAVRGMLAPYVEGQQVEVDFLRNGRLVKRKTVEVHRAGRHYGGFQAFVRPDEPGKWAAVARHRASREQKGARTARKSWDLSYPALSEGRCGPVVLGFKRQLHRMGYIVNGGRCLNWRTQRGILAYRKVNEMARNFQATSSLVRDVYHGRGGYNVRHPDTAGVHMEAPLDRQVLVFARGSEPVAIYPVSTGKAETPTVTGSYQMEWTQPGYNSLDMYYSWYFYRGYAVHGYKSVPNHPASNGCIRTFEADQPEIFNRISEGDWIHVW